MKFSTSAKCFYYKVFTDIEAGGVGRRGNWTGQNTRLEDAVCCLRGQREVGERQAQLWCAGEGNRKPSQTQLKDGTQWAGGGGVSAIDCESVRRKRTLILSIDNLGLHGKRKSQYTSPSTGDPFFLC